jgi:hypothetical protein
MAQPPEKAYRIDRGEREQPDDEGESRDDIFVDECSVGADEEEEEEDAEETDEGESEG